MGAQMFNLKWNDFQENFSNSFRTLRKEKDLFDVTLVSDDEEHILAHKLILSSCSGVFKSILKKTSTSQQPLIYLSGVSSSNLVFIMDYIYQGEVDIPQEQLDEFLGVAKKLKIEGLTNEEEIKSNNRNESEKTKERECIIQQKEEVEVKDETQSPDMPSINKGSFQKLSAKNIWNFKKEKKTIDATGKPIVEIDKMIDDLIKFDDGSHTCSVCGLTAKLKGDMKRHIETHIKGLSLPCQNCDTILTTRRALQRHMSVHSKQ